MPRAISNGKPVCIGILEEANISPGGCLIKTESTIAPGTRIEIALTILGDGKRVQTEITGMVVRETREDARRAYGVEFVLETVGERQSAQWLYGQAMGC